MCMWLCLRHGNSRSVCDENVSMWLFVNVRLRGIILNITFVVKLCWISSIWFMFFFATKAYNNLYNNKMLRKFNNSHEIYYHPFYDYYFPFYWYETGIRWNRKRKVRSKNVTGKDSKVVKLAADKNTEDRSWSLWLSQFTSVIRLNFVEIVLYLFKIIKMTLCNTQNWLIISRFWHLHRKKEFSFHTLAGSLLPRI